MSDLRKRPEVQQLSLQMSMNLLRADFHGYNGKRLGLIHEQRRQQILSGPKSWINALVGEHDSPKPEQPAQPDSAAALLEKLELIAANIQRPPSPTGPPRPRPKSRLARPDPNFKGCGHCGSPNHRRVECDDCKASIAEHN